MTRWIPIVNRCFNDVDFRAYAKSLNVERSAWKPSGIVLHNTAEPDLTQWAGISWERHLAGLVSYYRDVEKWHAGPHLFCSPDGILCFTPIVTPGIHSPSWNSTCLGVEMVGNYVPGGKDRFDSGAGAVVHAHAVSAIATLCEVYHIDSGGIKLHREDPRTTHDCPGRQVIKVDFVAQVHTELIKRKSNAKPTG